MAGKREAKTSPRRVAAKARHTEFFNLRAAGFSLPEIAHRFNVSPQAVDQAIQKVMAEMPSEAADRYRTLLTVRLEKAAKFFESQMKQGAKADRLNAGGRFVRTNMELAKLHGCYVEVSVNTGPQGPTFIGQQNVQQNVTMKIDLSQFTEEDLVLYQGLLAKAIVKEVAVVPAPSNGHPDSPEGGNGKSDA